MYSSGQSHLREKQEEDIFISLHACCQMATENCKYIYALWQLKKTTTNKKTASENASCEPPKITYSARQLIKIFKGFKSEWE